MGKETADNVIAWAAASGGAFGAWWGYRNSPEHPVGAAVLGFAVCLFLGFNCVMAAAPHLMLRWYLNRGSGSASDRFSAASGTFLSLAAWFLFREVLGEAAWRPVLAVGAAIGLAAASRMLTARTG